MSRYKKRTSLYVFYLEFAFVKLGYIKFSGLRAGIMSTWMSGKL